MKFSHLLPVLVFASIILPPSHNRAFALASSWEFQGQDASAILFEAEVASSSIQFIDENGRPLAGAQVLIGYGENDPFPNNKFTTDSNGSLRVSTNWKTALPLTIDANGQVLTTFDAVNPTAKRLVVSKADGPDKLELGGETTDFGTLKNRDGLVDFGLVIPAFTMKDLFHFDMSAIISPEIDRISVLGRKIDLPSNLTLPDQTESYILPVRLNKPTYRTYVREPGVHSFFALHGRFPIKEVIDDVRQGKSMFEVINYFDFKEGSLEPVEVTGKSVKRDLAVNGFQFNKTVPVKAPRFPNDKSLLSLAMAEVDGVLVPTDLKRLMPGEAQNLKTSTKAQRTQILQVMTNSQNALGHSPKLMSLIDHANADVTAEVPSSIRILADASLAPSQLFNQLTFVLQDSGIKTAPQFLDMINPPKIEAGFIRLDTPKQLPKDVQPVATYLLFSDIEELNINGAKSEKRTRLWEVFADGWVSEIRLPNIAFKTQPQHRYRWEVMYLGGPNIPLTNEEKAANPYILDGITHVTRNAVDI